MIAFCRYLLPALLGIGLAVLLHNDNPTVAPEGILPPDSGLPLEFDPAVRTLAAVSSSAGYKGEDQPHDFDADQPYLTTPFGLTDITALLQDGHAEIDLPNGRHVTLTKESAWQQQDMRTVRFLADGLVGTITISTRDQDEQFFATIATRDDVFRLEGQFERDTRIFSHRLLAQRTSPHIEDFRHVPHPSHRHHDATSTL